MPDPSRLEELAQQQAREKAREAELAGKREAVRRDIGALKSKLTLAASELSKTAKQEQDIKSRLEKLTTEETELTLAIANDRSSTQELLAALQRVHNNPPPAMMVAPDDVANAAIAARLMAALTQDLKARSDALATKLAALDKTRGDIRAQQSRLNETEKTLQSQRKHLQSLVSDKTKLDSNLSAEQKLIQSRVASLASEATSLRDLIRQFERAANAVTPRLKPKRGDADKPRANPQLRASRSAPLGPLSLPSNSRPFSRAKGKLTAPVQGRLSKSYTKSRKGITVSTAKKAAVVSPYVGRIEFAGAFKNYENVVILNVGEGYFMLLTGLGETYVKTGEVVSKGEPLGLMPFNENDGAKLYIELRKNGTTINPTPWLGTTFARKG